MSRRQEFEGESSASQGKSAPEDQAVPGTTVSKEQPPSAGNNDPAGKSAQKRSIPGTTSTTDGNKTSESPPRPSLEEIKAAARAYALSSTTSSKKRVPAWQKGLPKHPQIPQQQQSKTKASPSNNQTGAKAKPARKPQATQQTYPPPGRYTYHPYQHGLAPGYQHAPHAHPHHHYYHHPPPPPPGGSQSTSKSSVTHQTIHAHPPPLPHVYPYHYHPPPYHHRPAPAFAQTTLNSTTTQKLIPSKATASATSTTPVDRASQYPLRSQHDPEDGARLSASVRIATPTEDQASWTAERLLQDENLDDYDRLVKGLNILEVDDVLQLFQDDDEDEYNAFEDPGGEEDDEEEDQVMAEEGEQGMQPKLENETPTLPGKAKSDSEHMPKSDSHADESETLHDTDDALYQELAEELGWLEEEDIEAAVASLLEHSSSKEEAARIDPSTNGEGSGSVSDSGRKDTTASRAACGARHSERSTSTPFKQKTVVTPDQYKQISSLLQQHYQLLVQQAVLTVRAAHYHRYHRSRTDRTDFLSGGETADDLVEILDAAVGMLEDLRQNREDAIRYSLQFKSWKTPKQRRSKRRKHRRAKRGSTVRSTKEPSDGCGQTLDTTHAKMGTPTSERRLTRAQFQRTLVEQSKGEKVAHTVFDIRGLLKLDDTFSLIDKSVQHDESNSQPQLLEIESNKEACEYVLNATQLTFDQSLVPGSRDVSQNFCDAREFFGPEFKPPSDEKQQSACRRNRNLFTAGEDNLVLRGVNLYGEKQWVLIADRFLPERSTNIISQRYSMLCVLLYKANGIVIDADGRLDKPPKLESIDDIDEMAVKKLKPVQAPAILNVHRWSLEEDLTLLKAVPITGHMWAELGARLIPHRYRGHLRKRYQVLERRVKSTVERSNKRDFLKSLEQGAARAPKVPDDTKSVAPQKQNVDARSVGHEGRSYLAPARSHPGHPPSGVGQSETTKTAVKARSSRPQSTPSTALVTAPLPVPPLPAPHVYSPHSHPPLYSYPYPVYGSPPPPYPPYAYPHHHPYSPYLPAVPPPYHDPYLAEEGSRAAFEKLAREGEDTTGASGWSQMSQQMQELMKTENMVASAMAVDLARSPSKTEADKQRKGGDKSEVAKESVGLLAGVLDQAKKSDGSKASDSKARDQKANDLKASPPSQNNNPVKKEAVSPTKVSPSEAAAAAAAEAKEQETTPARDPSKGRIFSTDGTQIGLSPAFQQSPAQGVWPKIPGIPSPALGNLSVASFPPTSQMVGFSPSLHPSPQAEMTPPAHSLDTVAMQHLGQSGQSVTSKRKVLFQDAPISSTLSENDLDAISGLNLMASSPGLPSPADKGEKKGKASEVEERSSLFAKVVGDQDSKDRKKRKLVF